jgi:hypothetical protein
MNIVSRVVMVLSAIFTGLGVSITGNNASEKRRTLIDEIRNDLSQLQFLLRSPSLD